jgi:iron complex outermembrane receptor protein
MLEGTLAGAATDNAGNFRIENVPEGPYRLNVSVIGYGEASIDITVEKGRDLSVNVTLARAPIEMAPVLVTATRREEDILEVPVGFTVITPRDIQKRDANSPDEILRFAPGVVVTDTQVDVRGSGGFNRGAGSRMLLLVDGIPALAGDTGDIKWDLVPPSQIQRIEIVKSAASSLYGSTALGGVINIITVPVAEEPRTGFKIFSGYFDDPYHSEWKWTAKWLTFSGIDLSHTRKLCDLGLSVGLGLKRNEGYRRNSDFERSSLTTKLTYPAGVVRFTLFNAWALEKHGHATEWLSQAEALDIDPAAHRDRVRSEKAAGYLKAATMPDMVSAVSVVLNWYHTRWRNDFHDVKDNSRALRLGGSVQLDRIISPRVDITLGCDGRRTGVASTMFGDREIAEAGVFAEIKGAASEGIAMRLGTRYDAHLLAEDRVWEGLVSPRAAIVVRTGERSSLNASVGRGFRAPTVAEMFTSTTVGGFTVKPNPELASERGITYEIGWMGTPWRHLHTRMAIFRSAYDNLIEPEIDPADGSLRFTNLRDAVVSGFEGLVRAVFIRDLADLGLSYMYLSTEDVDRKMPLAYRSRHNLKVSLDISRERYAVGADFLFRSRLQRVKVYEDDERVPIYVTDLRAEVRRIGGFRLSGKIANLFNYNYTEIERNLAPIRSFRLSLSGEF